jgi:regulator of protease activity HflC (stomatin/prohibitin superfamily)
MPKAIVPIAVAIVLILLVAAFGTRLYKTVPPGHVAVATIFGKVVQDPFPEGLHVPVNPLYEWHLYDARSKTHKETANVPSQDQLQTSLEVSVQYRINAAMTPTMLRDTGDADQAKFVHLVPKLRSLLREQGKSIVRAEDFFQEETQERLQANLLSGMKTYLQPKGLDVEAVLIRDITLPPFIIKAIEAKKEREQEVEKQKAELERFRTEQEQKVAAAQAERQAAEEQANRKRILADAQAYEIEQINRAVAANPAYLQLQAMDALKAIARDPAAKIYFLDGASPTPLPLMNVGDPVMAAPRGN